MGVVTVLLAAQAPAKRAAKVSPVAAVSGGQQNTAARCPVRLGGRKIEITLGVHHAMASTKNWLLMTASFALSIVLALCFSVLLTFAGILLPEDRRPAAHPARRHGRMGCNRRGGHPHYHGARRGGYGHALLLR